VDLTFDNYLSPAKVYVFSDITKDFWGFFLGFSAGDSPRYEKKEPFSDIKKFF